MTDYKAVNPDENFDWEAFENGGVKPEMNKEDLTKIYDNTLNEIKDKEVTEGTIISMNKREVVVDRLQIRRYHPDERIPRRRYQSRRQS